MLPIPSDIPRPAGGKEVRLMATRKGAKPPKRTVRRVVRKGNKPGPKTVTVKPHRRSKPSC